MGANAFGGLPGFRWKSSPSKAKTDATDAAAAADEHAVPLLMEVPPHSLHPIGFSQQSHERVKALEQELIDSVCRWSIFVLTYFCGLGCFFGYLGGHPWAQLANPAVVVLWGLGVSIFTKDVSIKAASQFIALALMVTRHAIFYQGCSACVVPALFGFFPCAVGFVYRTPSAVFWSALGVVVLTLFIFAVDLSGNCPSQPIDPSEKGSIIADRLIPLVALIFGNSVILTVIVRQSQYSLQLSVEAARSALELANLRRDVLHRVTHELRTPLNGLVGSVELLTASETIMEHDMANVLTVQSCLTNILGICDDVLVAAKESDHGAAAREVKPFLLASCIDDVAEIFVATVQAKGVELKVEFDGDTNTVVRGLEVKLRQVLLNLVGNAIKFTDQGSITIRVCVRDSDKDDDDDQRLRCEFEVQDTGAGIDTQDSDLLFEPFHQGEHGGVASRRHKGTGLGLTISRDMVALMGGRIAVEGARGKGSRFYFTLMLPKEPPSRNIDIAPPPPIPDSTCRILIVDSDEPSRRSCRSLVQSIVPSVSKANIITRPDSDTKALLDLIEESDQQKAINGIGSNGCEATEKRRVLLIEYDPLEPAFFSTLSHIRNAGWLVFVYCNREDFAKVVELSADAYAVFLRPLPLVRMGNCLSEALAGKPPSIARQYQSSPSLTVGEQKKEQGSKDDCELNATVSPAGRGTVVTTKPALSRVTPQRILLDPRAKVVVVDDTDVNVRVLVKMLDRTTTAPVLSFHDGQSAIDLVESSHPEELLLILLDWHMPGVCGLSATESIRKTIRERGGPRVYICMVTADTEGLCTEAARRRISYRGTISAAGYAEVPEFSSGHGGERKSENALVVIDAVAGKPVTFQSLQAMLRWFQEQVDKSK